MIYTTTADTIFHIRVRQSRGPLQLDVGSRPEIER